MKHEVIQNVMSHAAGSGDSVCERNHMIRKMFANAFDTRFNTFWVSTQQKNVHKKNYELQQSQCTRSSGVHFVQLFLFCHGARPKIDPMTAQHLMEFQNRNEHHFFESNLFRYRITSTKQCSGILFQSNSTTLDFH